MSLVNITIGIITYKRPELLSLSLNSLKNLIIPQDINLNILIIDNDFNLSAKDVIYYFQKDFPFKIIYKTEPKKGIPQARNKVLDLCIDQDYIGFIDDDDTVDSNWILEGYNAIKKYNADVVKGYVNYIFSEEKKYLKQLDIFCNPIQKTGECLDSAWTNNVLFSTRVYRGNKIRFDGRFTKIGGSDNHFFRQINKAGWKIVMSREAIVNSYITKDRGSFFWLLRRNIRVGANNTISDILFLGYKKTFKILLKSLPKTTKYLYNLCKSAISKNITFLSPLMYLGFIIGRLLGLFGYSPKEYK